MYNPSGTDWKLATKVRTSSEKFISWDYKYWEFSCSVFILLVTAYSDFNTIWNYTGQYGYMELYSTSRSQVRWHLVCVLCQMQSLRKVFAAFYEAHSAFAWHALASIGSRSSSRTLRTRGHRSSLRSISHTAAYGEANSPMTSSGEALYWVHQLQGYPTTLDPRRSAYCGTKGALCEWFWVAFQFDFQLRLKHNGK